MTALDLSSYSQQELTQVLRILRDYRMARKHIGSRARLQDPNVPVERDLRIEYPQDVAVDILMPFVAQQVEYFFPEASIQPSCFVSRPNLVGGVRIFYGDDMVDISFERFSYKLSQKLSLF